MSEPPSIEELFNDDDDLAPGPLDDAAETCDDGDDLVALAGAAASRFAEEAAAQAAEAAALARRRDRLHAEDDRDELGVVLQYPSALFPPPPVLRLRVPAGWVAVPVPDAEMAVRHPEVIEGFIPNVVVRVRRTAATAAVHDDVRSVVALDAPPDDVEVLSDEVAADVTTPVRRVAMRFPGPGGLALVARQLLAYVPATEQVANIVSVVGTWPEAAPAGVAEEVATVVSSLRLFTPR